ncbi:MAG: S8 family serine peptidase [Acidobacteria bacterium]|nr:S8 family serine peptidase [Acidobacteriota bacterium]
MTVALLAPLLALAPLDAGDSRNERKTPRLRPHASDRILVRFRDKTPDLSVAHSTDSRRFKRIRKYSRFGNLHLLELPNDVQVDVAIESLHRDPTVLYAEPDYNVHAHGVPDDPLFLSQWGLLNAGVAGNTAGPGISGPHAWDISTGSRSVVIGVLDTGVDFTHPDLAANVWNNPGDCNGNAQDDDDDGYADDCHGIDVVNHDSDPKDDNGHGTHVSGTIAAVGDNGIGVTGTAWRASLVGCKFLDSQGEGSVSGAVQCLDYLARLKDLGVDIVATNNSWGGAGYSQALHDAVAAHLQRGILFVASAGNDADDLDAYATYPASYSLSNVIAVAATDDKNQVAPFSNEGRSSVHLGAPGVDVLSTWPGETYELQSGTSMAAPHVTGVAALLKSADPTRDWRAIRNLILAGGDDRSSLSGTITGKRLSAFGSLTCSNKVVIARLSPAGRALRASVGAPVLLSVLHIDCSEPAGAVEVSVEPGGPQILLNDDGLDGDAVPGDGVYSATWTPTTVGDSTLVFPGDDRTSIRVDAGAAPQLFSQVTFLPGVSGSSLQAVAIGDMNSDGLNDVVVTTDRSSDPALSHSVQVFLQNHSGTLDAPIRYEVEDPLSFYDVVSVALGDLNGDGRTDAAIASYGAAQSFAGVFLQDPNGALQPLVKWPTPDCWRVAIGDLNGDGRADLIAGAVHDDNVVLTPFIQDSSGALQQEAPIEFALAYTPIFVDLAVADVTGDGLDDIVALTTNSGPRSSESRRLAVLRQKPGGGFDSPEKFGYGPRTAFLRAMAVGDLNGDGLIDVAVIHGGNRGINNPYVSIFYQDGLGSFAPSVEYPAYEIPGSSAIADLDGDGRADLITAHVGSGGVSVYFGADNAALFPFVVNRVWDTGAYNPHALGVGDLNDDGQPDMVVAGSGGTLQVLYTQPPAPQDQSGLFVGIDGAGHGYVDSEPAGVSCRSTCSVSFPYGTQITLHAHADPGSRFNGWQFDCRSILPDGSCSFRLFRGESVWASFVPETAHSSLSVNLSGLGRGRVSSVPTGISCPPLCSVDYFGRTAVALAASPEPGSSFDGWSGACVGTGLCALSVDAPQTVGVRFIRAIVPTTPQNGTVFYADDDPPQFEWSPGQSERFKVTWTKPAASEKPGGAIRTTWLAGTAFMPGPRTWMEILGLARHSGSVSWSVEGRGLSGEKQMAATTIIHLAPAKTAAVTSPADGQALSLQDPPPTLTWEPNHNSSYRIVFSSQPDLKGTVVASGAGFSLRGTTWAMPLGLWKKIAKQNFPSGMGTVYYSLFARDAIGRTTQSTVRKLSLQ